MNIISVSTIWPNQIHYNTTAICSQQHWSLPQWSSNSICEKKLCKGNISWVLAGPLKIIGPGRAELKLNRVGWVQGIIGPLWAGPGHFFVARFEPCRVTAKRSGRNNIKWTDPQRILQNSVFILFSFLCYAQTCSALYFFPVEKA